MLPLAIGIGFAVRGVEVGRGQAAVLPLVDQARELARRPALLVEPLGLDELLEDAKLVVGVEDGEIALQPYQFGVAAQHLRRDAVKGAEPRHPLDRVADHPADALAHLARRLVGEGDGQDFGRPRAPRRDDVRQPRRQRRRLAGARPCEHQHRAFGGQHRLPLRTVQPLQIGRVRRVRRGKIGRGGGAAVHARTIRERRRCCPVQGGGTRRRCAADGLWSCAGAHDPFKATRHHEGKGRRPWI